MPYTPNKSAQVTGTLASQVADDGTLVVAYPTGTSQLSFNAGLAGTDSYIILNNNDKYSLGDPGISVTYGASDITITNLSGGAWASGSSYIINLDQVDGDASDVVTLSFPVDLVNITAAGDVVTEFRPGVAGKIESWSFVVNKPVTTAAKLATLNLEIDTTNVTAGTIALTSAAATPQGKVIEGATITGANTLTRESKLSVEASAVTAFSEGTGSIQIRIRKTGN
jgi:hypothetical protein